MGPLVIAGNGAGQVDAFDKVLHTAQPVHDVADIIRPIRFRPDNPICIHKVPRIQHDTYILSRKTAEEIVHILRFQRIESRPEYVFKEYLYCLRHFIRHGAVYFRRRFQHFPAAVAETACPDFLHTAVCHMPHKVRRFFRQGCPDIVPDPPLPGFHRGTAEIIDKGLLRREILLI